MNEDELAEARDILAAQWAAPLPKTNLNRAQLLDALEERILELLETNQDKLMSTLYILDIAEARYNAAMGQPVLQAQARALAEAVFDRETEKIALRRKYARGQARLEEDAGR